MPFTNEETDAQLLERMGTDPKAWAAEYIKMPHQREHPDQLMPQLVAWFHNALCAGRREGLATAKAFATPPGKTPLRGLCMEETCRHRWPVAWLPMEVDATVKLMERATCPLCGSTRVGVGGEN